MVKTSFLFVGFKHLLQEKQKGSGGQVPEASQAQITHQSFLQNHSTHPGPVQKLNGFPVEQHLPPQ